LKYYLEDDLQPGSNFPSIIFLWMSLGLPSQFAIIEGLPRSSFLYQYQRLLAEGSMTGANRTLLKMILGSIQGMAISTG
jgi:hypothetical protein